MIVLALRADAPARAQRQRPGRVFVARRGGRGPTTTILGAREPADLVERMLS